MNENIIKLPYNVGDTIFIVENYNPYYDTDYTSIHTIFGTDIVIKNIIAEGFIIDDEGIHLAEDGHDGWNKLTTYHNLTLEEYGDCKMFGSLIEAQEFIKTIGS